MRKYTISRACMRVHTIDVFADSADEAIEQARDTDLGEWRYDGEMDETAKYQLEDSCELDYELWDNGGRTIDRYTLIVPQTNVQLSMSHNPGEPTGAFFRHVFRGTADNIGKRVELDAVPAKVRAIVEKEVGL